MSKTVDYFFSLNSPWSYLGHARFMDYVQRYDVEVIVHCVDFTKTIFAETGGVPVAKRSPQRQAYRLQELDRWRAHLDIPLNPKPAHWPANEDLSARIVYLMAAGPSKDATHNALAFAGRIMRCVWAEDRDMGAEATVRDVLTELGHNADELIAGAADDKWAQQRADESRDAIERNVFGAPSWIIDDQVYWGQDRLDFVERHLAS